MDGQSLAQITSALETVHQGSSSSEARREAQEFLETLKLRDDGAFIGWTLAGASHAGVVRHFGLGLLQHAIQYHLAAMSEEKRVRLRGWLVDLASQVQESDPYYIREKLAYLWVAVAKRVWGLDARLDSRHDDVAPTDGWIDMDVMLKELWGRDSAGRELSLGILRTLFEDLYLLDDAVAAKRGGILSAQCIEIVTPAEDLQAIYDNRVPHLQRLRADDEGWILKWARSMKELQVRDDPESTRQLLRLLETLKSCLYWAFPRTIQSAGILALLSTAITHSDVRVRILTCDNLHVLFTRNYPQRHDFDAIAGQVMKQEGIEWLRTVYDKMPTSAANVDEQEYIFTKKFIEMVVGLGEFMDTPKHPLSGDAFIQGYFELLLKISRHPSLMVSGIALQFWCSILRHDQILEKYDVERTLPGLLRVACERCIHYESMPEEHESHIYMAIDFDSTPESQSFYGSYRKYMEDVIRLTVCQIPVDSLTWLHENMTQFFQTQHGWEVMNKVALEPTEPAFIYGSGQFAIVEAALRGIARWELWNPAEERKRSEGQIHAMLVEWVQQMLQLEVQDTGMHGKLVECLVQYSPHLKDEHKLMFSILERVVKACTYDYPEESEQNEAQRERVKDLRTLSGTELNRMAYMVPETLVQIYDDLETVISNLLASGKVREQESVSFKSFLLVVSQRSSLANKSEKFSLLVDPVISSWTEEATMQGLMDLEWFMERVGIVRIAEYFRSRGLAATSNMLEAPMDDAGRALKQELKNKWQALFPIRPTRIFIQYSIERLKHDSPEYLHLLSMWKPRIQPILPHILQLIYQIFAYHNPANWSNLPAEVQEFVKVSCTERFWQVGVSMQTKDEFENQSLEASKTLRDFADSVGHIVRYTREYAFLTLGSITQLEETLFELDGMGQLLYKALAGETAGITSHCWRHMISLVVRNVVKNCPIALMPRFLVDFVPPFLQTIDAVLVRKWERQSQDGFQLMDADCNEDDDDLSEEMMEEHLLRQLTAIVDRLLIDLVGQCGVKADLSEHKLALRELCTTNDSILFAILSLCRHIMLFKDGRCCFNTCLIVRGLATPKLLENSAVATYFLEEIMPACLGILADPYFHESHGEAGTILTTIYVTLRARSDAPLAKLRSLLPEPPQEAFVELEDALVNARNHRQQRGIVLDFLASWRVMHTDDETRARSQRRVEQRASRRHEPRDSYDAAAVISMFGSD